MIILVILGSLALLYAAGILVAAIFGYGNLAKSRQEKSKLALARCLEREEFTPEALELPWEAEKVFSPRRNSSLAVWALPGAASGTAGGGTVITLHGITWDHYVEIKYALGFIERGWNVVMVDLPGHGDSPDGTLPTPSYGYYEKYDLDAVVDWARARFPTAGPLLLAGESMGAATALQYLPLGGEKIDGVIADCSFTSMADEGIVLYKLSHVPACILYPARALGGMLTKIFRGYSFYEVSPLKASLSSPAPVLFIHGGEDRFVPTWMSVRMAEARRQAGLAATALAVIDGAGHAKSVLTDRERWFREAFAFIDAYCRQTN
jgi:alpha-beta hydrolase superfamily lysophospholipase